MGDISRHFNRSEFACKCGCGFDTVDAMLLAVVEDIRDHFDTPFSPNSSCRCADYNNQVGGSKASQHVQGRACDITIKGVDPKDVVVYLLYKYPGAMGIGSYSTFTHIDTRTDGPARWEG